jgi:hypothetical protein
MKFKHKNIIVFLLLSLCVSDCNKLVEVSEPVNTITTLETFQNEANATSAMNGIYSHMSRPALYSYNTYKYASGGTTINCGMSADEFTPYNFTSSYNYNTLLPNGDGADVNLDFWTPIYSDIYKANAVIEGVTSSATLKTAFKNQLIGEAKFIRAFCHFYLVNLFGDVPLVTTTAFAVTATLPRTPVDQVYLQIVSDLKDAQKTLLTDYTISNGERIRVNKWSATAMLARVYLYQQKWDSAEIQATSVINNSSLFSLDTLNGVFLKNNFEAIWQLQLIDQPAYATSDGYQFIPYDSTSSPNYFLTNELLQAFEPGDARRKNWVDSTRYDDGNSITTFFYPYKYKVRVGIQGDEMECYTLLRLAEQYLIRAEARANKSAVDLPGAISDLNVIRKRANLPDLSPSLSQSQLITVVAQERRVELFAEWGHRWLDLKRTGQADAVLGPIKPQWRQTAKLYPIPQSEIQVDPNLRQNPGY